MPRPDLARRRHLDSLTGLRFAAALGVFGFHAHPLLPRWPVLAPLITGGQSGVSFFFVLSGFVLTWSAAGDQVAAPTFWRRRAARILPAYWVAWACGIPVTWLAFGAWPSAAALFGTGTLSQSWIDDKSVYFGVNGVGWSLSCEVLFYALFPALLFLIGRTTRRSVGCIAGGCVAVLIVLDVVGWQIAGIAAGDPAGSTFWWVSVLPVSRLPEFVLGMAAGQAVANDALPRLSLRWVALGAGAALYVAGLGPAAAVVGGLTVLPYALLICAAAQAEISGRAGSLATRWWVRLGTWSYSFYLTHQLVLRVWDRLWPPTGALWLHLVVGLTTAIAVSAALYRFVEQPAERRWRERVELPG